MYQPALSFGSSVAVADAQAIGSLFRQSMNAVSAAYWTLADPVRAAVDQVRTILVVADNELMGDLGNGAVRFNVPYLTGGSVAWTGSLLAHEGQHMLNHGKPAYAGAALWKDEQLASQTQLALGLRIGMSEYEADFLTKWFADSNQAAMQQHMTGGMRARPPIARS